MISLLSRGEIHPPIVSVLNIRKTHLTTDEVVFLSWTSGATPGRGKSGWVWYGSPVVKTPCGRRFDQTTEKDRWKTVKMYRVRV